MHEFIHRWGPASPPRYGPIRSGQQWKGLWAIGRLTLCPIVFLGANCEWGQLLGAMGSWSASPAPNLGVVGQLGAGSHWFPATVHIIATGQRSGCSGQSAHSAIMVAGRLYM